MPKLTVRREIQNLAAYVPGLSIAEIQQKYHLSQVIKMASNENPLGTSPLVQEAIARHAAEAFRYPQGGNPRLTSALAVRHGVDARRIVVGNGSDEIIDLCIRVLAEPGQHNMVCFEPCFSIYPIQAHICGVEIRRQPLRDDFSFDFVQLLTHVDNNTRLVFVTMPDNPSGYCPPLVEIESLARTLAMQFPHCLLVVDEAYMDFSTNEAATSLLASGHMPDNVAVTRTFSKSFGLAGLRLGYAVLPGELAEYLWRARLPFSVNILAEEAALAAFNDTAFYEATLSAVAVGRKKLQDGLTNLGCTVWPSAANFLMFRLPEGGPAAHVCFEYLLTHGIIIRPLKSYGLPQHLRVSVGTMQENQAFLDALAQCLAEQSVHGEDV